MNTNEVHSVSSDSPPPALTKRAQQKRALILGAAMRYFAEHGYEAARIADIASELGIAKGSVFQHFGSKDGLFLESYKHAVQSLPDYLEVPDSVKDDGFFAVIRYRLQHPEHIRDHHATEYKVVLLGNYGSDMNVKKRINRFLQREDPLGLNALIGMGIERGEIRTDVDPVLIASILQCTLERFIDTMLMAENDPELFHQADRPKSKAAEQHIDEFLRILKDAIGARAKA